MRLHPLWPLLKGDVTHKGSDGHPGPHSPTEDVFLFFASSEDDLKTKASIRDGRDCDCQRMNILPVVVLMPIGKLFPDPALEVRNVARQVHIRWLLR